MARTRVKPGTPPEDAHGERRMCEIRCAALRGVSPADLSVSRTGPCLPSHGWRIPDRIGQEPLARGLRLWYDESVSAKRVGSSPGGVPSFGSGPTGYPIRILPAPSSPMLRACACQLYVRCGPCPAYRTHRAIPALHRFATGGGCRRSAGNRSLGGVVCKAGADSCVGSRE